MLVYGTKLSATGRGISSKKIAKKHIRSQIYSALWFQLTLHVESFTTKNRVKYYVTTSTFFQTDIWFPEKTFFKPILVFLTIFLHFQFINKRIWTFTFPFKDELSVGNWWRNLKCWNWYNFGKNQSDNFHSTTASIFLQIFQKPKKKNKIGKL